MGAKQKLRLALASSTIHAPIWEKGEVHWENGKIACPYCKVERKAKSLLDLIQYGLIDHDLVITVLQCRACDKMFGVRYTMPHEVDEIEIEGRLG